MPSEPPPYFEPSNPSDTSAASRLCAACGLCCNGVLFEIVRLQPVDSAKQLASFGIKLKSRHAEPYFKQPCNAFCGTHCSIYDHRPQRCRRFDCRQLLRVAASEITEAGALETIRQARELVARIEILLNAAGDTNAKKPLLRRCRNALAHCTTTHEAPAVWHASLKELTQALEDRLNTDFRIEPVLAGSA